MASFKQIDNAHTAEKRYVAKRILYVESEEDVQIFAERWFNDRGDKVEFRAAGQDEGGGCNQVIRQVHDDRANDIDAYGIIDRDSLKSQGNWTAFFATDDAVFRQIACAEEPYIHVLRYWEIENYLLHPEVLEMFLADAFRRSPRSIEKILSELFDLTCLLIMVIAADVVFNRHGQRSLDSGFWAGQTRLDIDDGLHKRLSSVATEVEAVFDEYDEYVAKIVAFGENTPHRSLTHWLALLRILDGKRLVIWIQHHYRLQHDPCGHLARLSRSKLSNILDPEIFALVG